MSLRKPKHNGNCWRDAVVYECLRCGKGNLCDVCHEHDAPRGECNSCGLPCLACAAEDAARSTGDHTEDGT